MPGPKPKPLHLRQRRNKASTRATLKAGGMRAPALPVRACACGGPQPERQRRKGPGRPCKRRPLCEVCGGTGVLPWHAETHATWLLWWASEAASQWVDADVPGIKRLILLVEDFHRTERPAERSVMEKEIRLQEARYGLSPLDRRRLEWSIEAPPDEVEASPPPEPEKPREDPRNVLRMVKPA